jgi:hypothetical protein
MPADDAVTAKLAEWEALTEGATEGPWDTDGGGTSIGHGDKWVAHVVDQQEPNEPVQARADAEFIAAARTAMPALLAFVREVQGLAEWHETKAEKALAFPGAGHENVMEKAAQVHDDAARRLRQAARKWIGGEG